MNQDWIKWEGQIVGGKFPLQKYLGGSDHSIVFLTKRATQQSLRAVIKLVAIDEKRAETRLAGWAQASTLTHPHILQIFEAGRCQIGSAALLYVVMEHADENLAEVVSERHLSPPEAKEVLPPVLSALAYLHGQGLVHGNLQPSNIMASGEQVKISSDSIRPANLAWDDPPSASDSRPPEAATGVLTPAADVWSLGMTLSKVSPTPDSADQRTEEGSRAFRNMLEHCLLPDPEQRWTVNEITQWLDRRSSIQDVTGVPKGTDPATSPLLQNSKWAIGLVAALALTLLAFFGLRQRGTSRAEVSHPQSQQPVPASVPSAAANSVSKLPTEVQPAKTLRAPAFTTPGTVVHKVLPNVPRSARRTIQGHIRVAVKVQVDASGNVTSATLDSPGPSEYFARLATESARHWRFSPVRVAGQEIASAWIIKFSFSRRATDANPTLIGQ